jgi:hypothetical protein
MTRIAFLILIVISVMTGSCTSGKQKLDKKDLIPEKELVSILTDIHLADGLLNLPKVNLWASSLDSITSYYLVIEKHGYTKEAMDKTMKYYFLENPKKLNKIYDQVLGILSEMESRVEKQALLEQARNSNLWRGTEFYSIPPLSGKESTMFDTTLYRAGYYSLTFSAIFFPDDQSVSSRGTVFLCSPDSLETGKRKYFRSAEYIKDGRLHYYTLFLTVPLNTIRHLKGWFYDLNTNPSGLEQHILIENISIAFTIMPAK